jgi:hypothetical protein
LKNNDWASETKAVIDTEENSSKNLISLNFALQTTELSDKTASIKSVSITNIAALSKAVTMLTAIRGCIKSFIVYTREYAFDRVFCVTKYFVELIKASLLHM